MPEATRLQAIRILILEPERLKKRLALGPNRVADPNGGAWDAYVWVDNADRLSNEFKSKGVKIAPDICDQAYGNRDFEIEDCTGQSFYPETRRTELRCCHVRQSIHIQKSRNVSQGW